MTARRSQASAKLALGEGWRSRARDFVPRRAREAIWAVRRATRPRVTAADFLGTTPVSRIWGLDRGTPVDRHYVATFLREQQNDIRGRVAEMADARYTTEFGGDRVDRSDVLHLVAGNPMATIVGDLVTGAGMPTEAFDCMIIVNTFRLIYDVESALRTAHRALRPGGVLLATFDAVAARCPDAPEWEGDFWRFTSAGVRRLSSAVYGQENVSLRTFGNVRTATALLYGLAAEDLTAEVLATADPDYEVTIGVRAVKA